MAHFMLLTAFLVPVPLQPLSGSSDLMAPCNLHSEASSTGGCCPDGSPTICGTWVWTYSAWCEGDCPSGQSCQVTEQQLVIAYRKKVCSGLCGGSCVVLESTTTLGFRPVSCACRDVGGGT